jgi:hypothetical protein
MEEIQILEKRINEVGAKAIKFKVGGDAMSNNADQVEGRSEGLIFLARKYFGDSMIIHADGNGSFTPKVAIEYGKCSRDQRLFLRRALPLRLPVETKEAADGVDIPLPSANRRPACAGSAAHRV